MRISFSLFPIARSSQPAANGCRIAPALLGLSCALLAQNPAVPQAPANPQAPAAVQQVPPTPQLPITPSERPSMVITLDQAIDLARKNNPTLQASRTLIYQNKEQEVTANLRPNPLLSLDAQYLPIFTPDLWSADYIDTTAQFDAGIGYLFERGKKRQHRLLAAQDVTAVTEAQVADAERTTIANAAQEFVAALLAHSNLDFASQLLQSYLHTVEISQTQQKNGAMSKVDLLKIQLQTLQFQSDVSAARIAKVQALASLRQVIGFDSVPLHFDVAGSLACTPISSHLEDLQARALQLRPDLQAAQRSITSARSQIALAKANARQDFNLSFDYTHLNSSNLGAFYFNMPLPIFNRNQGEVARNYYVLTQAQFQEQAVEQQVLTDVKNAYEVLRNSELVVQLYNQGYLDQAGQALEITRFSYEQGAASLLDFLDAERSYRTTELTYRQSLATCMTALEQLRQAVGTRDFP